MREIALEWVDGLLVWKLALMPQLTWVSIARNSVHDEDLASIGTLRALEYLDLSGNAEISDRGLAALQGLKNLRVLDLSRTGVGAGLAASLAGWTALQTINLSDTRVSAETRERLRHGRPGLRIIAHQTERR